MRARHLRRSPPSPQRTRSHRRLSSLVMASRTEPAAGSSASAADQDLRRPDATQGLRASFRSRAKRIRPFPASATKRDAVGSLGPRRRSSLRGSNRSALASSMSSKGSAVETMMTPCLPPAAARISVPSSGEAPRPLTWVLKTSETSGYAFAVTSKSSASGLLGRGKVLSLVGRAFASSGKIELFARLHDVHGLDQLRVLGQVAGKLDRLGRRVRLLFRAVAGREAQDRSDGE